MSKIKLERGGRVIQRLRADWDANRTQYELRGFKEFTEKPKPEPKPEPKVDSEWQKEEPKPKKTSKKAE